MDFMKHIPILIIFLLLGLHTINNGEDQSLLTGLNIITVPGTNDSSHSHDCTSDGDDILPSRYDVSMKPCYSSSDLINLYNGIAVSTMSYLIWQPPKL